MKEHVTQEIQNLIDKRKPLPKGTRIESTIGGIPVGGSHELKDFVLEGANKVPNHLSDTDPFWIHGWKDLHHKLFLPVLDKCEHGTPGHHPCEQCDE